MSAPSLTTVWTLLPNGYNDTGQLRLSALVSFRPKTADGNKTLISSFADLVDWPAVIKQSSWNVKFDNESEPRVATVMNTGTGVDSQLWQSLFPASTTFVKPDAFQDYSRNRIFSFGAHQISQVTRTLYKHVADGGKNDSLWDFYREVGTGTRRGQAAAYDNPISLADHGGNTDAYFFSDNGPYPERRESRPSPEKPQMSIPPDTALQFARGNLFYNRGRPPLDKPLQVPAWEPDLIEMLSALSSHPSILRKLGIVVDLIVDAPTSNQSSVTLITLNNTASRTSIGLTTATTLTDKVFRAVPLGEQSDISDNGLLKLESANFAIENIEIDGSMIKVSDFSSAPRQSPSDGNIPVLPALRSGGITVMRLQRDMYVLERINKQKDFNHSLLNANASLVLHADDLVRGYRVDVLHNKKWRSLCYRKGTVKVADAQPIDLPSLAAGATSTDQAEGYISSTSASAPLDPGEFRINVHEAVFGWDGWSLVASRPGRSISTDPNATAPKKTSNTSKPGPLLIDTTVSVYPGTLPKLRFGSSYQFRARVVDLAGNSIPLDENTPDDHISLPIVYKRWEPVTAPTVVMCAPCTEGESCEHLVIRSDGTGSAISYAEILNKNANNGVAYDAVCKRWIAPPKVSQHTAETHGMFDPIIGDVPTTKTVQRAYEVAKKESGTFLDTHALDTSIDPPVQKEQKDRAVITPPAGRDTGEIAPRGAALQPGQYVVHPNQPELPYLPDPIAYGFVLLNRSNNLASHDWRGTWPELRVDSVRLQEGPDEPPRFVSDGTGVTVFLRKGKMVSLEYASTMRQESLPYMDLFDEQTQSVDEVKGGKNPVFSPRRNITFVHAVQKPTTAPVINEFTANRGAEGETFVTIIGTIRGERDGDPIGNSTGSISAKATWSDIVDLPGTDPTAHVPSSASPFEVKVTYDEDIVPLSNLRHDFGDTKARTVTYDFYGATRYREYFPVNITKDSDLISIKGGQIQALILNSAKPPAPNVLYVVPTFRWISTPDGSRKRTGGGLRIYVNRPWYASGAGELLAVIIDSDPAKPTTIMGHDPIWASRRNAVHLFASDFVTDDPNAQPRILQYGSTTTALGYSPNFNAGRGLWYFDIEVSRSKSVVPMVRLALARLQPDSLPGLELSDSVYADFISPSPDRTCSVTKEGSNANVSVHGTFVRNAFTSNNSTVSGRTVTAQVESINVAHPEDDDLGWQSYGSAVELTMPFPLDPEDATLSFLTGKLPLPPQTGDLPKYRLAVRELEYFASDDDTQEGFGPVFIGGSPQSYRTRIVYACNMPL